MSIVRFKRFTNPRALLGARPELLAAFFDSFGAQLSGCALTPPSPDLPTDAYCRQVARFLMAPEALPDALNEALFAVDEMSTPRGRERLEAALLARPDLARPEDSRSPLDTALLVWLAAPQFLAAMHNCERMSRLTAFEHYTRATQPEPGLLNLESSPPPRTLEELTAALDEWFARNHRGRCTTRIERYEVAGEDWYLVRHGDAFSRTPKVEQWRTEIIHFRPEKDDVVVYCPALDEVRINARTRRERQAYRQFFGAFLKGDGNYFCGRKTYTLEPLRTDGPDALDTQDVDGIDRVKLREVEVAVDSAHKEVFILQADDVFEYAAATRRPAIPRIGNIRRAAFDFYFDDSDRPHPVQIRLPNLIKLGRNCDSRLVNELLARRGFRLKAGP